MDDHQQAEAAIRRLIEASDLPEPDAVEYRDRTPCSSGTSRSSRCRSTSRRRHPG